MSVGLDGWPDAPKRGALRAEIEAMDPLTAFEPDAEVRRRAIQYTSRLSLMDACYAMARQDVARERANAARHDPPTEADCPTLGGIWEAWRDWLQQRTYRGPLALAAGALLGASVWTGAPVVWVALVSAARAWWGA